MSLSDSHYNNQCSLVDGLETDFFECLVRQINKVYFLPYMSWPYIIKYTYKRHLYAIQIVSRCPLELYKIRFSCYC